LTCRLFTADPSGASEEFEQFLGVCPADLREGKIATGDGSIIECPKLFDALAVDWLGTNTLEYRKISVALVAQALKPGCRREKAVTMNELSRSLSKIVLDMETEEEPKNVLATNGSTYSAFADSPMRPDRDFS
jgi:hypothetical protein